MRRLLALLFAFVLIAAACGGDDGGSTASDPEGSSGVETDTGDDEPDDGGDDGAEGGGAVGESGGTTDQGLVETLGLPACPAGAHLDADGTIEIDFWHAYTAQTAGAMEDLTAGFNASQEKIVVTPQAQGSYEELLAKYRESIAFDDLPALAVTDAQAFRDVVDSGTTLPAQSCVETDEFPLTGVDELIRSSFSIEGALYPSATFISTPVLYYNRTHFEEAGLDPDSPPQTLAEVRDAARAIKAAGVAETPLSFLMQGWFVDTWLTGADVPLLNADNGRAGNATEATFNGPEALEIYTLLEEMNNEGLILPFSNVPGEVGQFLALANPGTASMLFETSTASTTIAGVLGGTSNLADLIADAGLDEEVVGATDLTIDVDVAPFPGLNEAGQIFASGGLVYMTDTGSDAERAAAWEFVKYINEAAQQKIIHLKGSYLPVNSEVAADPEVQAVWENDSAGQWLATAFAQLADIDPDFPGPLVGPFTEHRDIINASLEELLLSGADPAAVLDNAEAEVTEALAAYLDANF
jgi:sn-glycerol 3-phosphate transport system substrate-binding protein